MLAGTACFNGLFFSHLPAYLSTVLHYDARAAVYSQTVGVIAASVAILGVGWLGERVPPRRLLQAGVTLLAVLAFPFYAALARHSGSLTMLLTLAGIISGLTNGSFACLLTDLFPTRVRFTGVALVFNIAFTLFSGTAPLTATALIRQLDTPSAPAFLMMGCGLLALAGSLLMPRHGGHVLRSAQAPRPAPEY
jgi:MFS family permease